MENFDYAIVEEAAKQLYIKALCDLPPDVREALKKAYARETQPAARSIFEAMFKAIEIADTKETLLCQDTGLPIYKVKLAPATHGMARRSRQPSMKVPNGLRWNSPSAAARPTTSRASTLRPRWAPVFR